MKTVFLQFPDQETAESVLEQLTEYQLTIDTIGIIYIGTGSYYTTEEGHELEYIEPIPGWHVNVLIDLTPTDLIQYEVFPKNPRRVFAV